MIELYCLAKVVGLVFAMSLQNVAVMAPLKLLYLIILRNIDSLSSFFLLLPSTHTAC